MGLFGKSKQRQFNTATASALPAMPPASEIINHYYAPSRVGTILALFAVVIGLFILSWHGLVFLADQAGVARPEKTISECLLGFAFVVGLAVLVIAAGRFFLSDILDHVQRMKDKEIELERARLLAAQTTIDPGRMNEEDFNFARVVLACMMVAYGWQEKNGRPDFNRRWRPWSMRSALDVGNSIGVKLTQDRANGVSTWLYGHGVITSPDGGQVTKNFPNLSSVRALLDNEFGRPINVTLSPEVRRNDGFEHI